MSDQNGSLFAAHAPGPDPAHSSAVHRARAAVISARAANLPADSPERTALEADAAASLARAARPGPWSVRARDDAARAANIHEVARDDR